MPAQREKTNTTSKHFNLPYTFLKTGAKNGLLSGCFFRIGSRGDIIWDWDLLEEKLKELAARTDKKVPEVVEYGKLRRVQP
ncbi:hypothetical protein [Pseudobacteroides cellulosolvens]|uniref:Uncharacterized protein n=1 Tax=Pseudobacteroides cellulosolvens ATCC 35603 = DSM 2933 TaxID=398512 RepID=A0A0L6JW52_9FIRM|nr:hypothetical protein [Pseudobacteroides cellulosolvens]KNY29840.1 hypothetical protein Bccel_5117 [Pseudobacteroides cellulosolvens ATCC 35603 = DSM 2933]